ncbi:uncharacterized protein LOC130942039 [Arachis stenosperma]|uniref:uncharacterized protein LOC130942039 n=1 Tax=Arachis stenosperma TaxID=217475 RepID=UPI0025ACA347|nr:uncharacterized protein LOC130942039 [Arachis stenosperma]
MKNLTSSHSTFSSPSSSSSPSSLSTLLSVEPTFCNPESATSGCISAIFRRILCSRALPTHASRHIRHLHSMMGSDKDEELKAKHKKKEAAFCEAGVVAKLMGLETAMEGSVSSSMECFLGDHQGVDRSVKGSSSSSSFHGMPTTFHLHENEDFLVFSFGSNYSKGKKKKKKRNKSVCDMCDVSSINVGELEEEIVKRKKRNDNACLAKNKVANECSSEDSSPVSVFDFHRQLLQTDNADSLGVDLNWRRKLTPELENEKQHVLHSDSDILLLLEEEKLNLATENNKHKMKQRHNNDYEDVWGQICKLVEHDLFGSNQIEAERTRKQGEIENITADFESQIFCHLLNELIDQLVISS